MRGSSNPPGKLRANPRDTRPRPSNNFSDSGSDVSSAVSMATTTYRHHFGSPVFGTSPPVSQPTATPPQPVLSKDTSHTPKTHGSCGVLVVGLGGANGTTLLAGIVAHRLGIKWHGPRGEPMEPNYNGCITQLDQKGIYGGVGYRDKVKGLADATMAAIGGWDIRPTKPGDALLRDQILDYDLVRQVQGEMNKTKVFRGVYDPQFIGTSQHATATHILSQEEAPTYSEALKCLRADIRYFKWRNGVVGHTTVIWSASVEPNSELVRRYKTASQLLEAIEMSDSERGGPLPPSILYAAAAILEGCSFINGGSQNTLGCPGLTELAREQPGVYCLGTDFKAGQTKFKTAAVEYLRTMGLVPKVIASSNHLGNNDMRNLSTAKTAASAKLRVKHDIFSPWQEDIDHKVSIMFTEMINDEKRDFVEYTSLGFLGQTHTMVTYTRASDSVLCVPLMLDGAVWCDFFSRCSWPYEKVSQALAYLFKVPEGAAKGVDPGFFRQMQALDAQVMAAHQSRASSSDVGTTPKKKVRIRPEEKSAEWAIPHDAHVICAGLACVDMQLADATGGDGGESIETFAGETSIGGGSVSMAVKTLARLVQGAPLDNGLYMQVTPPVVHSVIPLCKIGRDTTGEKLVDLLEVCGDACRNVETKYMKSARDKDPNARTALSVLPIYRDGRRGCFFDAASNETFSATEMADMIESLTAGSSGPSLDTSRMSSDELERYQADLERMAPMYGAFLFGYPHLLPGLQGEALAQTFVKARGSMLQGGITVLDLNGVPDATFRRTEDCLRAVADLKADKVIGPALEHIDIIHLNEDELQLLTGCVIKNSPGTEGQDDHSISLAANLFLIAGVAVVAVTRGKKGSFVSCNDAERFSKSPMLPSSWVDCTARIRAVELPENTYINSNGAGDSFTAGLLVAALLRHTGMTVPQNDSSTQEASQVVLAQPNLPKKTPIQQKKKMTPYNLYMQENYVTLKKQCNDDKKAIFTMCHNMWESETDDVKVLYERRAAEENEENVHDDQVLTEMDRLDSVNLDTSMESVVPRNLYMTNRSLNLESAVQFASLVAAHHVDTQHRDRPHLDVSQLLERALVFPSGLEEI